MEDTTRLTGPWIFLAALRFAAELGMLAALAISRFAFRGRKVVIVSSAPEEVVGPLGVARVCDHAAADFNADGRDDILLRDGNGNLGIWLMNGTTIIAGGFVGSLTGCGAGFGASTFASSVSSFSGSSSLGSSFGSSFGSSLGASAVLAGSSSRPACS